MEFSGKQYNVTDILDRAKADSRATHKMCLRDSMAGAALAAVPIIIIFLIFQKYFTKGIAMGAVKG